MCIINPFAVCENEKRVSFNDYNTLAVDNNTFPLNPITLVITFITVVPFVSNFSFLRELQRTHAPKTVLYYNPSSAMATSQEWMILEQAGSYTNYIAIIPLQLGLFPYFGSLNRTGLNLIWTPVYIYGYMYSAFRLRYTIRKYKNTFRKQKIDHDIPSRYVYIWKLGSFE